MIPIEQLREPAEPVSRSFVAMAAKAKEFLASQRWCKQIRQGYFDIGWEGILGVFLFEFEPAESSVDDSVWVIVGDLPTAYICRDLPNGATALSGYVYEMGKWARAAERGESVENLIPVNAPSTREYAGMLKSRLRFIRERLLPQVVDQLPGSWEEDLG